MAIERRGSQTYYYRKVRDGKKVRSVYAGRGAVGSICYQLDRLQKLALRPRPCGILEAIRKTYRYDQSVREWLDMEMGQLGFHRYKRGEWRKMNKENQIATASKDIAPKKEIDVMFYMSLLELSLTLTGEDAVLKAARNSVKQRVDELLGDGSSPIEEVLAKRIALCEFRVNLLETRAAQQTTHSKQAQVYEELHRANTGLIQACKALASVRRLPNLTLVQVNHGASKDQE